MQNDLENGLSLALYEEEIDRVHSSQTIPPAQKPFTKFLGLAAAGAGIFQGVCAIANIYNSFRARDTQDNLDKACRFSGKSREILAVILHNESTLKDEDNHLSLVMLASVLFEKEMETCLCQRIRCIAEEILRAIRDHNRHFNTEALESWASNQSMTTIAIIVMLLHGIRWGLQAKSESIENHILSIFHPAILDLLARKAPAHVANHIREDFRNPAVHGRKTYFEKSRYADLAKLMTSKHSFQEWLTSRSAECHPDDGLLHNHLLLARQYP